MTTSSYKVSSGIKSLDNIIDSFNIGDNVVWEVDENTPYDVFIRSFINQSFQNGQNTIYVSFNKPAQTILKEMGDLLSREHFKLIDCFAYGKTGNDKTVPDFYERAGGLNVIRVENPEDAGELTHALDSIEDNFARGARYIFDSLTGKLDLWENESDTFRFIAQTYRRLHDLEAVSYWFLEKGTHSKSFKEDLRNITQLVFDLSRKKDKFYIKALKLDNRPVGEAFKPHFFEIKDEDVNIMNSNGEQTINIGAKLKEMRLKRGMSQKELAEKVNLTPSFISQVENDQIRPSLNSFMHMCSALYITPGSFLSDTKPDMMQWLFRYDTVLSSPVSVEDSVAIFSVTENEKMSVKIVIFIPGKTLDKHFLYNRAQEFIYVLDGDISVTVEGVVEKLKSGDSIYLKESFPVQWKNLGQRDAKILIVQMY